MTFEGGTLPSAHVAVEDRQAAQHLVDAWSENYGRAVRDGVTLEEQHAALLLELRGMVAALAADCREAGYLEGTQRGRRDVARLILDALDGEGLTLGRTL